MLLDIQWDQGVDGGAGVNSVQEGVGRGYPECYGVCGDYYEFEHT